MTNKIRYCITSNVDGLFLGYWLGLGFWSTTYNHSQSEIPVFSSQQECQECIEDLFKERAGIEAVQIEVCESDLSKSIVGTEYASLSGLLRTPVSTYAREAIRNADEDPLKDEDTVEFSCL